MKLLNYYILASYRRKLLDKILKRHQYVYNGIVLDIGGKDRGKFLKPKNNVTKWIYADIESKNEPDIVLDVAKMNKIDNKSIDVINATELFEHVSNPEEGLAECHRILKPSGLMIISVPFLFPIHADPHDYQRWTLYKWETKLKQHTFKIEKIIIMGRFFTIICDMLKSLIMSMPKYLRIVSYLLLPLFDILILLDNTSWLKKNKKLSCYHGGYLFILKK